MLPCSILTVRFITELSVICVLCVQWFEERALQLETLDSQLKKLHSSIETLVMHRRGLFLSLSLCSGLFGILEWRPTSQPLTAYRMSYFTHSTYFSLFLLFKRGARCKGAEVLDDWSLNVNNRNG